MGVLKRIRVGDEVKVIYTADMDVTLGAIGTVEEIERGNLKVYVVNIRGKQFAFYENEIRLTSAHPNQSRLMNYDFWDDTIIRLVKGNGWLANLHKIMYEVRVSLRYGHDSCMTPEATWDDVRYILTQKYGRPIGSGRTRLVFKTKTGVIKLEYPLSFGCNESEHYSDLPKPNTRLFYIGGIPLLFMEWVEPATWEAYADYPDWVDFVDGFQVGYTRAGKLVAYDLC